MIQTLGERIKNRRQYNGLTQLDLARRCGLTQHWISHYECDRREPTLRNALALATALNVSVQDLTRGTELETKPTRRKGGK